MTDSNQSVGELPALIEERRRYEAWLAALDARRESTPAHVFDRVQADYRGRLQRVAEQLASHRQAIEEDLTSIRTRASLLQAEEQLRRDERAELDLRAHVGELEPDEAEGSFRAVDDAISQLVAEKETLASRTSELQALLDDGAVPPPATAPESSADEARAEKPVAADAAATSQVAETVTALQPAPPPAASAPPPPPALASAPRTASGSFDELEFLKTVVGKEDSPLVQRSISDSIVPARASGILRDDPAAQSLLAGLENVRRATGEHPLAANVPANTPIALRMSGAIEQSKTLKCNECGSMNYPTEWYCERCGAELAAL